MKDSQEQSLERMLSSSDCVVTRKVNTRIICKALTHPESIILLLTKSLRMIKSARHSYKHSYDIE